MNLADDFSLSTLFTESRKSNEYKRDVGSFQIKFANNLEELAQVFKLRYQVFFDASKQDRWDVDLFDLAADHLIILEKSTQQVIGTYRLISSEDTNTFYSQTEFHMDAIVNLKGSKVECGRACIHEDYRNGTTIALLWQGLGDYITTNNIRWMFGCSSVQLNTPAKLNLTHQHLMQKHLIHQSLQVTPIVAAFNCSLVEQTQGEERLANRILPPLLRTYLNLGAKICGLPHLDEEMHCIDYLTLLDTQQLDDSFEKRFCK